MKSNTKKIALTGILSAMSAILYIFPTFPIFPAFSWLEIDFADVPALIASIMVSPAVGGIVVLIRNTIHLLVSKTMMLGELSNFIISFVFVVGAGLIAKEVSGSFKTKTKSAALSVILAGLLQIVAGISVNYFIMIPLYSAFVNFAELGIPYYIFGGVVPFNAIKVAVVCTVFTLLYKYVCPLVKIPVK